MLTLHVTPFRLFIVQGSQQIELVHARPAVVALLQRFAEEKRIERLGPFTFSVDGEQLLEVLAAMYQGTIGT